MKQLRNHQNNAITALSLAIAGIINLPTGTGKTLIQSRAIVAEIEKSTEPKVYVILSPRILLSNQLLGDVKNDLVQNTTDCQYLVVHSGRVNNNDYTAFEKALDVQFREMSSTTRMDVIVETYEKAQREGVSLVISGTYHSAERIAKSGIPIEIVFCDEAHYLVQEQFSWIVTRPFPTNRIYHFTATLRETPANIGLGMNNQSIFGKILYQELPSAMIQAGEMVRPRMHVVDLSDDPEGDEADGLAVAQAFEEHRSAINVGAKMLVVAKDGSTHLNSLVTHPEIQHLKNVRPFLKIYDVSSEHGARIDGESVTRDEFLNALRSLKDYDEAIIVHYDILSEGIDVAGITGVMPLRSLKKAKFLQTLGRATRLHEQDRNSLYNKTLLPSEVRSFVKPYAWLIVPVYGLIGEDLRSDMKEMVRELRDHGFNPSEDIVVRQKRGKRQLDPIGTVTEPTRVVSGIVEFTGQVIHEIEDEEEANRLDGLASDISVMTQEELLADIFGEAA